MKGIEESEQDVLRRRFMAREQIRRRGIVNERLLAVMEYLPRQHFIPEEHRDEAYQDHPVEIGQGQTISQPYIVALMTDKLEVRAEQVVLEIGTGSGYQTAVLALLVRWVYTVERLGGLAADAQRNVGALGIENVSYRVGDGAQGWPERPGEGPLAGAELPLQFDRILVAAAGREVPGSLVEQLAEGGRMVLPVGPSSEQDLLLVEKVGGRVRESVICQCRFVRLISGADE